jgi:hypothetical protein
MSFLTIAVRFLRQTVDQVDLKSWTFIHLPVS